MDDVYSVGQTNPPFDRAFRAGADAVVVVPIKAFLDDAFPKSLFAARGSSKAKVHCVSLEQPALAAELRRIADATRGVYRNVSIDDARKSLRP